MYMTPKSYEYNIPDAAREVTNTAAGLAMVETAMPVAETIGHEISTAVGSVDLHAAESTTLGHIASNLGIEIQAAAPAIAALGIGYVGLKLMTSGFDERT